MSPVIATTLSFLEAHFDDLYFVGAYICADGLCNIHSSTIHNDYIQGVTRRSVKIISSTFQKKRFPKLIFVCLFISPKLYHELGKETQVRFTSRLTFVLYIFDIKINLSKNLFFFFLVWMMRYTKLIYFFYINEKTNIYLFKN